MPQASAGAVITAGSQIAADIILSSHILNDEIVNADINAAAAIVDTKLAQITTAEKVSGTALTLLPNIPAGAGVIPAANVPAVTMDWAELADVNLASANNQIASGNIASRGRLLIWLEIASVSASTIVYLEFNADSAANYGWRSSVNGAADVAAPDEGRVTLFTSAATGLSSIVFVINRAASQKSGHFYTTENIAAAAAPNRTEGAFKWNNTAAAITSLRVYVSAGHTMGANTRMIIYGSAD